MVQLATLSHGITKTGHMRVRHLKLLASMSHPPSLHTQAPRAGHNKEPPQGSNTWTSLAHMASSCFAKATP
ncbi:hypothetical protein TIFTF001_046242 [Ficus carica]|uniref:Uncharacterized protein n=2 Tax=Ficus carica TaxID=3494 RepID=A0AA87Z2S6_FICCA|nr:hypothetical protein TIFTF001_046242 [Ficus carica]